MKYIYGYDSNYVYTTKLLIGDSSDVPENYTTIQPENEGELGSYEFSTGSWLQYTKPSTLEELNYKSKQARDAAINADLLFYDSYFQVSDDCADIKSSLQEASVLGLEDSYSQLWRLADNTWRQTTIAEARQIVALFVARKQKVWAAFAEWDLGDKSSVFTYEEPFIENTTNSVVQETSQTGV